MGERASRPQHCKAAQGHSWEWNTLHTMQVSSVHATLMIYSRYEVCTAMKMLYIYVFKSGFE